MLEVLKAGIREQRDAASALFQRYLGFGRPYLLRSELWDEFQRFCGEDAGSGLRASGLARVIHSTQEAVIVAPWIYLAARPQLARWSYLRVHLETLEAGEVPVSAFLAFKEGPVLRANGRDGAWTLEFDIEPFNREFRRLQETRSIGRGVEFLNRRLSSQLFDGLGRGDKRLLGFLREHTCQGQQLMLNERAQDVACATPSAPPRICWPGNLLRRVGRMYGERCGSWASSRAGARMWSAFARRCVCCWTLSKRPTR